MKILNERDVERVSQKIMKKIMNNGEVIHFNLIIEEFGDFSNCHFTPFNPTEEGKTMLFTQDYGKLLHLLLSHPHVENIEFSEEKNLISAVYRKKRE